MSERTYAAKVVDGVVVQAIVGTAAWAVEHLGGEWRDSPTKVGIGWLWDETHGFRPPQPSPDCQWVDGAWVCPEPPEPDVF